MKIKARQRGDGEGAPLDVVDYMNLPPSYRMLDAYELRSGRLGYDWNLDEEEGFEDAEE